MDSNDELRALREQLEALRQQFAEYVEANSVTEQIDEILASHETLDGEATADGERRTRLGGKPAHLKRNAGMPGRTKLTDAERARRGYDYASRHDAKDIPDLRKAHRSARAREQPDQSRPFPVSMQTIRASLLARAAAKTLGCRR
jgi:hypothetical protein